MQGDVPVGGIHCTLVRLSTILPELSTDMHLFSICGQSAANRAQKTLQQNNELLKALLAKVISNDQSVRRESIFLDSDYRPASIIDLYCNSRSGRLSDYLTDVESTLSSSPISTARSSIATQRVSLDPELRVLRQSFHEILTGETEQEVDDAIPDSPAVSNDVSYTTNANKSSPGVPEDKRFDLAAHSDAQNETKLESQTSIRWLQGSRPEYTATDFETLCLYPMNTWTFRIDLARIYYQPINNYLNISDLHREILRGHPDLDRATLEWLLAKGVALDSKNEHGWTAMGVAIFVRDLRVAKLLHEVGAETYSWPNQPGGFSDPLELALRYRDYNIVLWLITAGIGVNLAGALNNPFRIALINQDINVAAFILSQEIRADSPFHLSGTTKADLLDHINRVPARIASSYPSTILHSSIAARLPFHELPMLPKLGANVNVRDYIGQTPHHCFCTPSTYAEDAPLILECLLDFKPDLEIQDKFGSTALHLAADGPEWIFQRLLRAGANPHCKNVKGSSPLDLAKKKRRQALL